VLKKELGTKWERPLPSKKPPPEALKRGQRRIEPYLKPGMPILPNLLNYQIRKEFGKGS